MASQKLVRCSMGAVFVLAGMLTLTVILKLSAQDLKPLDKPPADQTYVGEKTCASCHFDQDLTWRKTKHAKGYEELPEKYKKDKSCLKCHTTGFETASGFKSLEESPGLVGTSCEACHGPGSKHAEMAKATLGKELTPEQKKYYASSIYKVQPKAVCVECHLAQGHKKHPEYEKEKQ
jgi:hypothetical protein